MLLRGLKFSAVAKGRRIKQRIGLVSVAHCPVCGGSGREFARACPDASPSRVEFVANYSRCVRCASLWMHPRPSIEDVKHLYPNYYTHGQPTDDLAVPDGIRFAKFRHNLRLRLIELGFGYESMVYERRYLPALLAAVLGRLGVSRRWAGRTVRYLPARNSGRLLDVGCGNGAFLWLMQRLGWEVAGLEMDAEAARVASLRGPVTCGRVEDLTEPGYQYDAITLSHVLEHTPDPGSVLKRMMSLLRPGGLLVSISPDPESLIASLFRGCWRDLDPPRHLVLPSARGYAAMLRSTDAEVEVFTSMNGAPGIIQDSLSIVRSGRWGSQGGWVTAKVVAYIILPMLRMFTSRAGCELICLARRPA